MKCEFFLEREGCIGCGACAAIDPDNWEMNEDGKADLKENQSKGKGQKKEFEKKDLKKKYGNSTELSSKCHTYKKR